ncbi:hypothetical protein N7523_009551 [Penicillium sp. IBT 18751x]|nr:hypothetical protein N7523_009551 [Penicillium sp. IBT 18751x]
MQGPKIYSSKNKYAYVKVLHTFVDIEEKDRSIAVIIRSRHSIPEERNMKGVLQNKKDLSPLDAVLRSSRYAVVMPSPKTPEFYHMKTMMAWWKDE